MESAIDKEFVFNHFARKTSPLQRERMAQWLWEQPNEELYYEWLEEWENRHPQYVAQTEAAHQHYTTFLDHYPNPDVAESTQQRAGQRNWLLKKWLIAASVLLVLGSYLFFARDQFLYQTHETTFGETRSLRLSDGSVVTLNANSSLRVPRWRFGQSTRQVWLTGEATFSVTHMTGNQRFVVKTERQLDVVVLGTEFTVFARKRETRVALSKGRVQLQYHEGITPRQLVMKPGQLVTFDQKNHLALQVLKHPEQQSAWREKRFVFDETTLREVAYMLEESYGLTVDINDPELAQRVLVGSLQADNADQLLQSISELLDINVIRHGNRVQLLSH